MVDLDRYVIEYMGGWERKLPKMAIQGSVRNYIYFDGYAATSKIGPPKWL